MWQELHKYKEQDLHQAPPQGGWSAAQVIQHLYLAEMGSWQAVEKKLLSSTAIPQGTAQNRINSLKLTFFLRLPLRYKAPKVVGTKTIDKALQEVNSSAEIKDQWQDLRQQMTDQLENLSGETFKTALYRHPLIGYLTLAGMLRFFYEHQRRHFQQTRRVLQQL